MARVKDEAAKREIAEYRAATEAARKGRRRAAGEVGEYIASQVSDLIVDGDVMGGRSMVGMRLRAISEAERRGDQVAVRSAVMDLAAAAGAWVAAIDLEGSVFEELEAAA